MQLFPNYYDKFSCIADKCKHSCCIGWEIDVDDATMEYYSQLNTMLGEKIRANIEGDPPHFILKEGDRCPFLNERGLCEIILHSGEDALCDICTLHPRFKNFYSSFEEVGLGLCCEEVVRIILSSDEKFSIPEAKEAEIEEKAFFKLRQRVFDILQDREKTIERRFSILADMFSLDFSFSCDKTYEKLVKLERLDEKWIDELEKLKGSTFDPSVFAENPVCFEQLAVYFIFRHLKDGIWKGNYAETVNFAIESCYIIGALWQNYSDFEKRMDLVRMYSSEIEYSEENLEKVRGSLYA